MTADKPEISKALADKNFHTVAKAANVVGDRTLRDHLPELLKAYARFLTNPVKRDPNCIAKGAIARALVALDCDDVGFYLEGIRYVQREPVWGGSVDTAIDIRCSCAMGLVASGYSRALAELTTLLNDPEARVRAGAARAIACGNPREAEVLLRLKILVGDKEAEVIGDCFTGLLSAAPEESLGFVAARLADENDALRDFAALALGESRHPLALKHLRDAWDAVYPAAESNSVLIRAAALHRTEQAFEWLLSIIESGTQKHSEIAVDALSVFERNTKLHERVEAALAKRDSAAE